MKRRAATLLILTLFYTLLGMIALWPVPAGLNERIVGGGELGGWLWRYWWMKLEIQALSVELAHSPLQVFLHVISLGRFPETGNVTDLYAVSLPLEKIFGHPTYYNLKCLLIMVTNGLAGYALARAFTPSRVLGAVGGAVLAVNSFVALELFGCGLRQAILAPAALAILSFESVLRQGRWRDGLKTGFWFALTAIFYWFYGLFLAMFAVVRALAALPSWWRQTHRGRTVAVLVLSAVLAAGLAGIFTYPYIMFKVDHTGSLPEVQYLADFPSLAELQNAPPFPQSVSENLLASLARVLTSSWTLDYLWSPIHPFNITVVTGVVGLLFCLVNLRQTWLWLVLCLVFWIHSGGPYLQGSYNPEGRHFTEIGGEPVKLLYAYTFKYLPMMSRLFAPYRTAGFVWLMLVILVTQNLEWIRSRLSPNAMAVSDPPVPTEDVATEPGAGLEPFPPPTHPPAGEKIDLPAWVMAIVFVSLFVGQQLADGKIVAALNPNLVGSLGRGLPVESSVLEVPPFYHALAQEKGHIGVIELPLFVQQDLINYYQVVHEKKVMRGWAVPGSLPPILRFHREPKSEVTRLLQYLTDPDSMGPNSFIKAMEGLGRPPYKMESYDELDLRDLTRRGFRYVILHERGCYAVWPEHGRALYEAVRRRLARQLGDPAEMTEMVTEGDPGRAELEGKVGVLGNWASSALPIAEAERPTRFVMSVYRMPGSDWGKAWETAVSWPLSPEEAAAQQATSPKPVEGEGTPVPEINPTTSTSPTPSTQPAPAVVIPAETPAPVVPPPAQP